MIFEKKRINSWDTSYYYDYMFSDGSFLYTFAQTKYNGNYTYQHYIYNPLNNTKITLYDSYISSYDDIGGNYDIKVKKINNNKYEIYIYKFYDTNEEEFYTYYEKYEYDISNFSIKKVYIARRYTAGKVVFSTKKNYCKLEYQIMYLYPNAQTTRIEYDDNKKVSVSFSTSDSFCVITNSSQKIFDEYDEENELFYSYINNFNNIPNNLTKTEYDKKMDPSDTKLNDLVGTPSKIYNYAKGSYSSKFGVDGYASGILNRQIWEDENKIVIAYNCRNDKNRMEYNACFLTLNKIKDPELKKIS